MNLFILYQDIRTYGFKEKYYQEAREEGVIFIQYKDDAKPEVSALEDRLNVKIRDILLDRELLIDTDLLVLSTAIVPNPKNKELAQLFKLPLDQNGFFLEAHMKLRPVDFATDGIFVAGLCHYPKPLNESITQAQAAAGRAVTILSKEHLNVGGVVSWVDEDRCVACLTCLRMCPYDVPVIGEDGVAKIEAAKCQGCGICASECPAKAIQLMHYKDDQVMAKIDAMFDEVGYEQGIRA